MNTSFLYILQTYDVVQKVVHTILKRQFENKNPFHDLSVYWYRLLKNKEAKKIVIVLNFVAATVLTFMSTVVRLYTDSQFQSVVVMVAP